MDRPSIHGVPIFWQEFTGDGRLVLSRAGDSSARIWETATGRPVGPPIGAGNARDAHFSPDGRLVVAAGGDGQARLWNSDTRQLDGPALRHGGVLNVARFSPDGSRIVTGSEEGTAWLWETATRRPIQPLPRHDGPIIGAAFSPDGRLIVVHDRRGTARIWDAVAGRPRGVPIRVDGEIPHAEFSPDGRSILTCAGDTAPPLGRRHGTADRRADAPSGSRVPPGVLTRRDARRDFEPRWHRQDLGCRPVRAQPHDRPARSRGRDRRRRSRARHGSEFARAIFSPDRSHILLLGAEGLARLIETATGQTVGPPLKQRWPRVRAAAFSPDGRHAAISSHDVPFGEGGSTAGTCRIWDAASGSPASPLLPHINWVGAIAYRPDGKVLATGDYSKHVHFWDANTAARVGRPFHAGSYVCSLAFSPDGRTLAVGTAEPAFALLWDVEAGKPLRRPDSLPGHGHPSRL